jgi:hypothetical protein
LNDVDVSNVDGEQQRASDNIDYDQLDVDVELDQIPNNNLQNIHQDESGKEYEEEDEIVDVNDVKIIDGGDDFDEEDDSQKRSLNRHEENLAD